MEADEAKCKCERRRERETAKSSDIESGACASILQKVTKKMSRIQGIRQQYKGMHTNTFYSTLRLLYIAPGHQSVDLISACLIGALIEP